MIHQIPRGALHNANYKMSLAVHDTQKLNPKLKREVVVRKVKETLGVPLGNQMTALFRNYYGDNSIVVYPTPE